MKISIVGLGRVGTAIAFAVVMRRLADELVLVSRDLSAAQGHAADLAHASSFVKHADVRAGLPADTAASDIVVVCASAASNQTLNRLDEAQPNIALYRKLIPDLAARSPNAIFLIVTNPVDVMTYAAVKLSGLPPGRVFGSGTLIDTGRFRDLLARQMGIDTHDIRAYILGEHGDSQFAAASTASAGGAKLDLSQPELADCFDRTLRSGSEVVKLKGYTNFAIASAVAMILSTITENSRSVLPVSTLLDGYAGISDVCLSVPAVVGRGGVISLINLDLTTAERASLKRSADVVRETIKTAGL
jgi:L-lactate dehydrogenase